MPALYSTIVVTEPDYGERVVRVHAGLHHAGAPHTEGVDLVTGERVRVPIGTSWDSEGQRDVRVSAEGWYWHPIPLRDAEKRCGLPRGSLPSSTDTHRSDLWADERMRNPAFIALLTVLTEHPEVVFYEVDWRHWVHAQAPRRYRHIEDSPVLAEPRQDSVMDASRHLPYPLGGSGDMERYASSLGRHLGPPSSPAVIQADELHTTLSDAVLADLRQDYDRIVAWQRNPDAFRRLNPGPPDMPVARSFDQIQALVGWTPQLLDELDALHAETHARLDAETVKYRPQGVALALF